MSVRRFPLAVALVVSLHVPAHAADPEPEALATYPAPTFLENVAVAEDGSVYVTNYTARRIEVLRPDGRAETFAELDVHPVSLLLEGDGFLLAAHGASFADGPAFIGTSRLLTLDAAGAVTSDRPLPEALFANGMERLDDGRVLLADSAGSKILVVDPVAGTVGVWFSDPVLAPRSEPAFSPGVNGLKRSGDTLILSSSATRTLYGLPIGPDGEVAGALEPVAEGLPGADDFTVLPEGGFVVATHGDRVVRVGSEGDVATLTDDPRALGSTATALVGADADRRVIVLGTGGFSEGAGGDAVVLSVPSPGPEARRF